MPTGKTGGGRPGGGRVGGGVVGGGYVVSVVDYGFITTTISPGGVVRGYVVIQNNGNDVINDAIVHITVTQAGMAGTTITTQDQPLSNLNIAPGDQRRVEFAVAAPPSISPGSYDVQATVEANGQQVQSFTNTVTVT